MPAGTLTSNSSYIFLIRQEITPVGKRRASVPTTALPNRCSSKNTRKKVEDAIALVMKVMSKTMDSTTLGSEKRASVMVQPVPRLIISFAQSNFPLSR